MKAKENEYRRKKAVFLRKRQNRREEHRLHKFHRQEKENDSQQNQTDQATPAPELQPTQLDGTTEAQRVQVEHNCQIAQKQDLQRTQPNVAAEKPREQEYARKIAQTLFDTEVFIYSSSANSFRYNENQKNAKTIQLGAEAPEKERPQTKMPLSLTFPEEQTYFTTVFQAKLHEFEIDRKQAQKFETNEYDARGIMSLYTQSRVFAVIALGDNGRIPFGTQVELTYRIEPRWEDVQGKKVYKKQVPLTQRENEVNNAIVSYMGTVVEPIIGGAMGDVAIIINLTWK